MQCLLLLIATIGFAQNPTTQVYGGEVLVPQNSQPCLTDVQRNQIKAESLINIAQLRAAGTYQEPNVAGTHPLFIWPVTQASGHNYNVVYSLSNYVDHNAAFPGQISDYDCGTRSYDTNTGYNHKGFDIISWPFWWKQMDLNQAINVAAADGQIISKNDGSFDRNCDFNTDTPNYIGLQHDDGSQSWYLHMKDGGLTSKGVGESVNAGEFLGVIGSSGSSTIPHLHFEVFDSAGDLIDPSIGSCNTLNSDTWWIEQKPYWEPRINAALTHSYYPDFQTCPNTEITNESDQFDPSAQVFYAIYLKDQRVGTQVNLKAIRPDGTFNNVWDFDIPEDLTLAYYAWILPTDMEGEWTFEATYSGDTVSHTFNVGALGIEENELAKTIVYPNPLQDKLFIESESDITKVIIRDALGRSIATINKSSQTIKEIKVPEISKGIYFVTLTGANDEQKTIQLIKN